MISSHWPELSRLEFVLRRVLLDRYVAHWSAPLRLTNAANRRGHWRLHSEATREQRSLACAMTSGLIGDGNSVSIDRLRVAASRGELAVVIQRVAPRRLDSDGATASVKHIRDGIADALGLDDGDPRVTWLPAQQRRGVVGEYAVEVFFFEVHT